MAVAEAGAGAESMDKVGAGAENKSFRHPTLHCSIPYCIVLVKIFIEKIRWITEKKP